MDSKTNLDKGLRFNEGKLRYDLLHPVAEKGLVEVLTMGANKYAERNWELGMKWSKIISSLKRHIAKIEAGEDYDPESGLLHADHVQANAHFLSAYYKIYPQGDDRPHSYLNNKRIALDIDDVLADWAGEWAKLHGIERPKSWAFDRAIIQKFDAMQYHGTLDDFYANLPVLTRPEDIPFEPVAYVTSRPVSSAITEAWLDKNGFPAAPVYTVGLHGTKVEVLRDIVKADIFVDDRWDNFLELNKAGIFTYLFTALHNERYEVGHKRLNSLKDLA